MEERKMGNLEKTKIFSSTDCKEGEKIEDLINQWFKDNPKIRIKDRLMCQANNRGIVISIFYKEQ